MSALARCYPHGPRESVKVQTITVDRGAGLSLQAGADAFGVGTLAQTDVMMNVIDRGFATFMYGSLDLLAAAQGGAAFASTSAAFTAMNADIVVSNTTQTIGQNESGMSDHLSVSIAALDLAFDLPGLRDVSNGSLNLLDDSGIGTLSGNLAVLDSSINAYGSNSFVDLQADPIAVEGEFSSVVISAMAAVDSQLTYQLIIGTSRSDTIRMTNDAGVVMAGRGDDRVYGGAGDDWILGEQGRDQLAGGLGDDTLFGGHGNDCLDGGLGDDWLFGGDGRDELQGGVGADLLYGGDGSDSLHGGVGNDIMSGGDGHDCVAGGVGDDLFLLGAARGDGNDDYSGGVGADLYLMGDRFDDDTIRDFSLAGGDRLALGGAFASLSPDDIDMSRSRGDRSDLVIEFDVDCRTSTLVLDNFFAQNPGFNAMPMRGDFSDAQVEFMMSALTAPGGNSQDLDQAQMSVLFANMLSLIA